ncbi:hypothetical protein [Staphylococcus phage vB_SauH_DELF3]|nr:hypothetical protein [Staphylococcus phage vB_SauH_DELF3]
MAVVTKDYHKVRRRFPPSPIIWEYTNTGLVTQPKKGSNVCVTLLDSIARNNLTKNKFCRNPGKMPSIPCCHPSLVIKCIEYKLKT